MVATRSVIIMRGLPGSGKDFFIQKVFKDQGLPVVVCSADEYHVAPDGVYRFDPANLRNAHDACFRKFTFAVLDERERRIIVNNVNAKKENFQRYIDVVKNDSDVFVEVVYPFDHPEKSEDITVGLIRRFAARNVHGVPVETIAKMAAQWED